METIGLSFGGLSVRNLLLRLHQLLYNIRRLFVCYDMCSTCKAEDAQLLACSFVFPRVGAPGAPGASNALVDPLPVALLLPPCRGLLQLCCCFCCCCCSCSSHGAPASSGAHATVAAQSASPVEAAQSAADDTTGCGGLCSVAAAIRTARLSDWGPHRIPHCSSPYHPHHQCRGSSLQDLSIGNPLGLVEITWCNWRENIDVLEMSFLRLRDTPNIHSLVGLRRLELSENQLTSIQVSTTMAFGVFRYFCQYP